MENENELIEQEPAGALDTAIDYETEYRRRVKERESKFGEMIGAIDAATKKVLETPVQQRPGFFRELAGALARPTDPRDPRFYEKRNFFTALRDVGEYGARRKEEEKKLLEARQAQVEKLQDLKRKYEFEEAQSLEDRAFEAMKTFGKPQKGRTLVSDAQKILDLESIISSDTASASAKKAAETQLKNLMEKPRDPAATTELGQIIQAFRMAESPDPKVRAAGLKYLRSRERSGQLTTEQSRSDIMIMNARAFINGVPERELKLAQQASSFVQTPRQREILKNLELSKKPTLAEVMQLQGGRSAGLPESEEEVIDERMPGA